MADRAQTRIAAVLRGRTVRTGNFTHRRMVRTQALVDEAAITPLPPPSDMEVDQLWDWGAHDEL